MHADEDYGRVRSAILSLAYSVHHVVYGRWPSPEFRDIVFRSIIL